MTGRRELHRRLFAYSGVCAVCGRSPAAVPGAGPARRLQPFHSCVLASRTLPQRAERAHDHASIAAGPAAPATNGDRGYRKQLRS